MRSALDICRGLILGLSFLLIPAAQAQSPEFLQLMGEIKTAIKHSSANVTRGEQCAPQMFDMAKEGIQANEFTELLNRVVVDPLETGAKVAAGALGVPGGAVTTYSLVRCYMKEADWEGLKRCALGEALGYAGGKGLDKIDIDGLENALAGAAWDKAYGALREAVENYQQASENINWTAGGKCQLAVTAVWNKRRMPGAEGGMISVQINANACRCNAPSELERGNMRFRVPVRYVRAGADQPGWATDTNRETTMRVQCCGQRREGKVTRYRLDGGFSEFVGEPRESVTPPPPPTKPVAPPPPPEPQWSDANPCPECQPFLDLAEKHRLAAEELDAQAQEIQERLQANRQRQRATQQRIDQINKEIAGKAGEGGSATDPDSGLTTESWTQPDGSVKVTVKDARGNVLSERTRQRRDVARLRERIAREEAELARLKAEEAKLNGDLDRAVKGRQTQRKLEADARAELHRCVEERCKRRTAAAAAQTACAFPAVRPVTIGPREQFGYGEAQKAGEVGKAALGILGGFLGGRGGGGRASGPFSGPGGDKPPLADDPIRDKQTFTDAQTGTAIKVGGQYRPDGKLLVSVDVDKAEDKGVVHHAALERLVPQPDGSCKTQVAEPIEWLHYEIWEDWWAKIRIQRYESVDGGPWRKTHDTGWRDWGSGSRLLESGTLPADQIPRTAWGSMGADRAFGGPRSAGAVFDPGQPLVTGQPVPERLVVHVTQPGKDPVTTVPFTLYPTYANDGKVSYGNTAPEFDKWMKESSKPKPGELDKVFKDPPVGLGGRPKLEPGPASPRFGERLE
jgi:hypothetical protein